MSSISGNDPAIIGPYRVLRVIHRSEMSTVYMGASATSMAAIKILATKWASDAIMRERFKREIRLAEAISSPHISRILESGVANGRPWIATEYIPGLSLSEKVHTYGVLDTVAVTKLGIAVCAALAKVHAAGVVHRDVKPSNIMLGQSGPVLVDLGIAFDPGDTLTKTAERIGSPGYMAPEYLNGHKPTAAVDVFGLTATLAFAATGRAPFVGDNPMVVIAAILHRQPDLTGIPGTLRMVLLTGLNKDPEHRPTLTEFCRRLSRVRFTSQPVSPPTRTTPQSTRPTPPYPQFQRGVGFVPPSALPTKRETNPGQAPDRSDASERLFRETIAAINSGAVFHVGPPRPLKPQPAEPSATTPPPVEPQPAITKEAEPANHEAGQHQVDQPQTTDAPRQAGAGSWLLRRQRSIPRPVDLSASAEIVVPMPQISPQPGEPVLPAPPAYKSPPPTHPAPVFQTPAPWQPMQPPGLEGWPGMIAPSEWPPGKPPNRSYTGVITTLGLLSAGLTFVIGRWPAVQAPHHGRGFYVVGTILFVLLIIAAAHAVDTIHRDNINLNDTVLFGFFLIVAIVGAPFKFGLPALGRTLAILETRDLPTDYSFSEIMYLTGLGLLMCLTLLWHFARYSR